MTADSAAWLDTATTERDGESGIVRSASVVGERLGRYRLIRRIGAGAMGCVYEAYDPLLERAVAIKVPRPGSTADQLRREAKALARLVHPNVISVHDVGELEGRSFVVLELVEGMTLREWLGAERRSFPAVIDVLVAAGRGLAAVHAVGLVHRDFKPENVIVGHDERVRVVDFGIASAAMSSEGHVAGTPAYMAPEQHVGIAVGAFADQFSFCVVLWEVLFGGRPYHNADLLKLRAGNRAVQPCIPSGEHSVPAWLSQLIARGLMIDANARHPSMGTLLDAIELGLDHRVND
jgi:serine/threonine-protein kinase